MIEEVPTVAGSLAQWLGFLSTLIWQLIVIASLIIFRRPIVQLVSRIVKIKYRESEILLQEQADDAKPPGGTAGKELESLLVDPDGFLTPRGVAQLIERSSLVQPGESVVGTPLLIFSTRKQRTWLVATRRQLFCVLDDEKTRSSQRLIQWNMPLPDATDLGVRRRKEGPGHVLDVGPRRNWLYSDSLFPTPDTLLKRVTQLLQEARAGAPPPDPAPPR